MWKPPILDQADNRIQKKEVSMYKCTQLAPYIQDLFGGLPDARKTTKIVAGIMIVSSPRLIEIVRAMGVNCMCELQVYSAVSG
jgi:hypothetical protein